MNTGKIICQKYIEERKRCKEQCGHCSIYYKPLETRGGPGRGQGRKSPFKEKTKGVKFMCPISKEPDLKKYVNRKL